MSPAMSLSALLTGIRARCQLALSMMLLVVTFFCEKNVFAFRRFLENDWFWCRIQQISIEETKTAFRRHKQTETQNKASDKQILVTIGLIESFNLSDKLH